MRFCYAAKILAASTLAANTLEANRNGNGRSWLNTKIGLFLSTILFVVLALTHSIQANAQSAESSPILSLTQQQAFSKLYEAELGPMRNCEGNTRDEIAFCSKSLKNSGNAPRIFLPAKTPKAVIVLFHGLSDSPYFVRSLAQSFQGQDYLVITPLTPGHGKKVADADMQDPNLQQRWLSHLDGVMSFANALNAPVFVGGFSGGGTLATWYALQHSEKVKGLLLFSGVLALSDSAETMSRVWGIKTIASWLDGKFQAIGAHPYKYPSTASYSGLVLMDVVQDIRLFLAANEIKTPIFAAHSMADNITRFSGVEDLLNKVSGEHMTFKVDAQYDVCHQDLTMSNIQLIGLKFDRNQVNQRERCAVPKANPLHQQMMFMANVFIEQQLR